MHSVSGYTAIIKLVCSGMHKDSSWHELFVVAVTNKNGRRRFPGQGRCKHSPISKISRKYPFILQCLFYKNIILFQSYIFNKYIFAIKITIIAWYLPIKLYFYLLNAIKLIRPIQIPLEPNCLPATQCHYKLACADHTIHHSRAPRRMRNAIGWYLFDYRCIAARTFCLTSKRLFRSSQFFGQDSQLQTKTNRKSSNSFLWTIPGNLESC